MRTAFIVDGGAGRVLASMPAFMKYAKNHPNEDWRIFIGGWDYLFWGITELQNRVYNIEMKGAFEDYIKDADNLISPEPYRLPGYFRQTLSLAEAFDEIINQTTDHSDLSPPKMIFNKQETFIAKNTMIDLKNGQKKQKSIVFQPFGRGAKVDPNQGVFDEESRSLTPGDYVFIAQKLASRYNLVFFGESDFHLKDDIYSAKFNCDLRQWGAIISQSDYFIGVDSVGQHMARAVNVPGTVIFGSTYPVNTSYPDYFQIIQNASVKKYSPIRIAGFDCMMANRMNESTMKFTTKELNDIVALLIADIEKKR